jgi:SOS-response transcriptional repressor LexA
MNKFIPRTFAQTLLLACQHKVPALVKRNNQLHQGLAAEYFGIAQPNFCRWMRTNSQPDSLKILKIAEKLHLKPAQMRGEEPIAGIDFHSTEDVDETTAQQLAALTRRVFLLSPEQAGRWSITTDTSQDVEGWYDIAAKVSPYSFALRVEGDSMNNPNGSPSLPEGAIAIVDPDIPAISGNIVLAKLNDSHQVTLKKLVIDYPFTYLKPLNPDHNIINVNDDWTILGVVKQVIQDI